MLHGLANSSMSGGSHRKPSKALPCGPLRALRALARAGWPCKPSPALASHCMPSPALTSSCAAR
eukprot:14089351-Alexandrium_andersonii.AAC.1